MFSISEAKIVGTADKSGWSQVHSFVPVKEKLDTHGILLLVLSIKNPSIDEEKKYDLATYGREVIQRFHEEYYGAEIHESLHLHLVKTIETINKEFSEIEKSIIAGVVFPRRDEQDEAHLYIATNDKSCRVNLLRGEKVYFFKWGIDGDGYSKSAVIGISGDIKSGDMLILGTYDLFVSFSKDVLEQALLTLNPSEAHGIISPWVHERGTNSRAAGIIVKFGEDVGELRQVNKEGRKAKGDLLGGGKQNFIFKIKATLDLLKSVSVIGRIPPFRIRLRGEQIVVKEDNGRKRKMMYSVAFVLLLMLGVSIFFGYRKRVEQERSEKFNSVWDVVEHQYKEAEALADLNPLRAKTLLNEAKNLIEETSVNDSDYLSTQQLRRLSERKDDITALLSSVSGEYRLEEVLVFLDLSLVRPNTYGEKVDIHGNTLVVLDPASKVLLSINIDNKSSEIIGGGQFFSGVKLASVYAERGFVLSDSGIVEIAIKGKTSKVVVEKDPEWGEVVDMAVFGGNLYLLDKGQEEIFRYQSSEGGFDSRQRWLGEGVFPDLSRASSLAIDGDVWVLNGDNIVRFRRGVQESFALSGLDISLSDAVGLYTDSESLRLYVLDRGNKRVIVFDKNGEYQEQYLWEGIETVSDLAVNEERGKMFLLSASELYSIELKD